MLKNVQFWTIIKPFIWKRFLVGLAFSPSFTQSQFPTYNNFSLQSEKKEALGDWTLIKWMSLFIVSRSQRQFKLLLPLVGNSVCVCVCVCVYVF